MTTRDNGELMTPAEAAAFWRVKVVTVSRWDREGLFPPGAVIRTPGGDRRYVTAAMRALRDGEQEAAP